MNRTISTSSAGTTLRVAAVVGIVVGSAALAPAPAEAADQRVKIVQHNVEKKWSAVQTAMTRAEEIGAEGITLQEVCQSFEGQIESAHPNWTVNWRSSRDEGCGANDNVGTVAIWTGGNGATEQYPKLTPDPGRTPRLTCVKYGSSPTRHICSVHLVSKDETNVRGKQTADVKRLTGEWIAKGDAVYVGGDFNASPGKPEMDAMYSLKGSGRFVEASQTANARAGDWTAQSSKGDKRKIDYVFFSQNRTGVADLFPNSTELSTTESDHRMMVVRADVRTG